MKYHVNRQGRKLGEFSLEELRRRQAAGELDGTEYVWSEAMEQWETLDTVLRQIAARRSAPPPIPTASKKARSSTLLATGIGVSVAIAGVLMFGYAVWLVVRQVQTAHRRGRPGEDKVIASKPVSSVAKTLTVADVKKHARAFRVRQWLDGYKERGERKSACDAENIRFIEAWLASEYGDGPPPGSPKPSELADRIAASAQCDDPLVLTLASSTGIEVHEITRRLERALHGFESSKHRAYPRFYAAVAFANELAGEQGTGLDSMAVRWFKECFTDGSFRPEDQTEISEFLVFGWGEKFFNRNGAAVQAIVRDAGKDYAWLALALDGEYHINEAWKARGTGYANTVTQEGWRGFSRHLAAARVSLTSAWQLRPDLPLAPCRMMTVTLGETGIEEMRQWFDRATAAQIDYPEAWSKLRWGLRPRWHGSLQSMLALGVTAVSTRRFDTDVPRKIMDVIRDLEEESDLKTGQHIYGRPDIWPNVQKMYEGYLAEPSQAAKQNRWHAEYAVVAYLAGRYEIAGKQLEALGWELPKTNLLGWGSDISLMTLEIAARTSPAGALVTKAEENYRRGNVPAALEQFKTLSQDTHLDARTSKFVRARVAILDLENRLHSGAWVDFMPSDTFDLTWTPIYGKYRQLPDGALEVETGNDGHMLFCRARVGPEFEVRGEFEVVRTSNKSYQAGLVVGNPDPRAGEWYGFRMKRNDVEGQIASFSNGWSRPRSPRPIVLRADRNTFDFRFQNGRATASFNGDPVLRDVETSHPLGLDSAHIYTGVGAFHDTNETVIRYRNLQIRKLAVPATAAR